LLLAVFLIDTKSGMSKLFDLISNDGLLIEYCKIQTEELCIAAVKQNGMALQFIKNPSINVCMEAYTQTHEAVKFIPKNILNAALNFMQ